MLRSRPVLLAAFVLAAGASACGPAQAGSVANGQIDQPGVRVDVSPNQTSVTIGADRQFQAAVSQAANTAVTWSVQGGGSISSNGLYTAPSAAGVYTVVASSVAAPAVKGSATVNVTSDGGGGGANYVFPADRITTWKPGVTYNGGIPNRTTVCATIDASTFGNGTQEASGAIQTAIGNCPEGQVVQLSAGTFLTNKFILVNKGITLRGAGAGKTILQKTNGAKMNSNTTADQSPIVVIGLDRWSHPNNSTSVNLTADGAKGATSVTVSNAAGFAAGQVVLLDELSGASWQSDALGRGQIWAAADGRTTWTFHNPAASGDDPLTATTPTAGNAASWFSRQDRVTSEMKEIASVSGNTITFTSPLHITYRASNPGSHTAQLTRYPGHVKKAGLEGFTIIGAADGGLHFEAAAYSWMKNVEVTVYTGEGIAINNSFRCELRDSYIHDAAYASPGGVAYNISLAQASAEILIENNISVMANKVMVARCAGAGSVVAYNYMDDAYINYDDRWLEIGINASHMVGGHHVLFEGNYGTNFDSDKTHGSAIYHTIFRNWLRGVRRPFQNPLHPEHGTIDDMTPGSRPLRAAGAQGYSYWFTFVGNVLGAAGKMSGWTYEVTGPKQANASPHVWALGWDDWQPEPFDAKVGPSTIRDGNWDWLNSRQTWHNNVTSATLPKSLYLSARPAFFGENPWPWVDPSTGTTYTLPAKARFDAGTPNEVP